MKTELQLLTHDEEESHLYIHAYNPLGFLLSSGTRIFGPIAIFPKSVLHWSVKNAEQINEDSLSLFPMLVPKLEIVVIGYGDKNTADNNTIFRYLKSHNINVEILPSDLACSTFNFLNLERRYVGAAIIPPAYVSSKGEFFGDNIAEEKMDPDVLIDPEEDMLESMSNFRQQFLGVKEPLEDKIRKAEFKKEQNRLKKDNSDKDKDS